MYLRGAAIEVIALFELLLMHFMFYEISHSPLGVVIEPNKPSRVLLRLGLNPYYMCSRLAREFLETNCASLALHMQSQS